MQSKKYHFAQYRNNNNNNNISNNSRSRLESCNFICLFFKPRVYTFCAVELFLVIALRSIKSNK